MPVASVTTSAAGSLNLLEDDDKDIRGYALNHLLSIVPQFWAEISEKISWLELLADPHSKELATEHQPYAALLLSKLYHYIGQDDEAVEFALRADQAFEKEAPGEYRDTIIAGCLDKAIAATARGEQLEDSLSQIVEAVLRAGTAENGKLAVGLALSLERIDLIETTFLQSRVASSSSSSHVTHDEGLLRYVLNEAISGHESWPVSFRTELLLVLHRLFMRNPKPDWSSLTVLWVQGDMKEQCGDALCTLYKAERLAEVYQIAFDINEIATQQFCMMVAGRIMDAGFGADDSLADDDPRNVIYDILTGVRSAQLSLNFMSKNHRTDQSIFKTSKDALEDRYSIYHSAITFSQGFANAGTGNDTFMRENLEWLARASNWAKFDVTAALGLVHKGSLRNGYRIVKPYLPGGPAPSKYSEGGALYALGLIHSGKKQGIEEELKAGLSEESDPVVQHGAALGFGVSAVASHSDEIYELLRTVLFQDNATSGEAAGYSMGLVMLGSASPKAVEEMLSYARETQHEKIIRSLAVGVSFLHYGLRDQAKPLIAQLTNDKDAILRYGGMFTIALAYAGTGSNEMVKKLLHFAVSDVNDDVRRAAVTALGFVLFRNHTQVPRIVQLLAESYNPHVRHGATLALGISCAGTGLEAAVELLEPMTRDPVDFVRQGAYISLAFVLIQQSEAQSPRTTAIRELFAKVVADKHEDPMARFGASLAQGIIDAGGRNATLSLSTRAGTLNMQAIVGMTLFVQFWYWFPLAHGLGMAFTPTGVVAVDEKLRVPDVDFTCHAKPSQFAYPTKVKKETEKKEKKAATAVLSTTAKAQARQRSKKAAEGEGDAMDMDDKPEDKAASDPSKPETTTATPKRQKPTEPNSFTVKNMTRVTPNQFSLLSFVANERYEPIRALGETLKEKKSAPFVCGNVVLLKDKKPETPESEGKFIELNPGLWAPVPTSAPTPYGLGGPQDPEAVTAAAAAPEGRGGAGAGAGASSNEPIAEPPASFEYPFED